MNSQEEKVNRVNYKGQTYDLYPVMLKKCPTVPSPYTTAEGKEFVIVLTKNNDYVLLPVTVENGEPYVYTKSGKGKQLEVNGKDFPTLARTGLHSELELDQVKTITGISISEITHNGRPNRASGVGFMAEDEDIISVLKGDNRLVKKLGLTHPRVAKPMFHLWNAILEQFAAYKKGRPWCEVKTILYNGKKISLEVGRTKGCQESIFNDEIYGGFNIYIRRGLEKKEKRFLEQHYSRLNEKQMEELVKKLSFIHTGEMEPYYIQRYGFYEGHTDYRTDPVAISFIFGLKSLREIEAAFKGKLYQVLTEHFTLEIVINRNIRLRPLAENIYLHTGFHKLSGFGRVSGNGLLVVSGTSAALIDTPWTDELTAVLFDWVKKELGARIEAVIPTHSHIDCTGGLGEAHRRGARSYGHEKTAFFAAEKGEPVPRVTFKKNYEITCGNIKLLLDYPGAGHTADNIVVWLPRRKILFCGCMIRSANSKSLGYTKEADLENWPAAIQAVRKKYGEAKIVIPGHGKPGSSNLLDLTLKLLEENK